MKLWKVDVTYTTFVLAKSEADAESEAIGYDVLHDLWDGNLDVFANEVLDEKSVPTEWLDSLPYTSTENEGMTCRKWLARFAEERAETERRARERAEFDSHPKLLEVSQPSTAQP